MLDNIATQRANTSPPPLVLNKHCHVCEFTSQCRRTAIDRDDLSLLPTIAGKERKHLHEKGIFTATQLSYTFRPRRRAGVVSRHNRHALRALALRKNQIHVVGAPTLSVEGTPIYFDVEGDPDRDFYYLVGVLVKSDEKAVHYSFWANDPSDERGMWADCVRTLRRIDNPRLIHYGSYETQFLKRMRSRYSDTGDGAFVDQLTSSALNLLSVIYAHVYFPTYSNSLKEVAPYLGFQWSDGQASGLTALVWRSQWESTRDPSLKLRLLTYNSDDCEALQKVAEALSALCHISDLGVPESEVVDVDSLKREYPQRFGEVDFVLPEFQKINEAALWDYQRDKIYVRSNRRMRQIRRRILDERFSRRTIRLNKVVDVEQSR